jgi:type I restriction enzyme, S subunit
VSFPSYDQYKHSGVARLGEMPMHWRCAPMKAVATVNDDVLTEATPPDFEMQYVEIGDVEFGKGILGANSTTFAEAPSRARRCVKDADVIVSTVRTYLRAIAQVVNPPRNMIVSTGFAVVRPRSLHSRFLGYLVESEYVIAEVISRSVGVSYPAINSSDLMCIKLPLPPISEQRGIAEFLDRETAKIDALITEQERLIALLKEKRQAVISHAVTKGLDPKAPLKDSGIEWLGAVPAHWETSKARRMFAVRSEPAREDDRMLTASQKHGVLYQTDFVELEGRRVVEVIMGKDSLKHVEPDDFIISMRSFQGGLEWSKLQGSTSFHYVMVTPIKNVYPSFFSYLLKSQTYVQALRTRLIPLTQGDL